MGQSTEKVRNHSLPQSRDNVANIIHINIYINVNVQTHFSHRTKRHMSLSHVTVQCHIYMAFRNTAFRNTAFRNTAARERQKKSICRLPTTMGATLAHVREKGLVRRTAQRLIANGPIEQNAPGRPKTPSVFHVYLPYCH